MEDYLIEKLEHEKKKLIGSCKGNFTLSKIEIEVLIKSLQVTKALKKDFDIKKKGEKHI